MEETLNKILVGLRHIATQLDKLSPADWRTQSNEISSLHTALAIAQQNMPSLLVDSAGYAGKYVSLPGLIEHIKKPLGEQGLAVTQEITEFNGKPYVVTTLRHESGEWTRSKTPLFFPKREEVPNNKDYNQECGKAISYMRRYALESLLLLKGDRDDYDSR